MPSDKLCHIFAQKEGVADPHRQRPQESDVILKPQNQLGKQLKTAGEEDQVLGPTLSWTSVPSYAKQEAGPDNSTSPFLL